MIQVPEKLVAEAHALSQITLWENKYVILEKPYWIFIKKFIDSKSPIETLMAGIMFRFVGYIDGAKDESEMGKLITPMCEFVTPDGEKLTFVPRYENTPYHKIKIEREAKVGKYRIDFLITVDDTKKIGIECDGYAYHEKSQEQMIYEKERDRYLSNEGIEMVHFMGKEIKDSMSTSEDCWTRGGCEIYLQIIPRICRVIFRE